MRTAAVRYALAFALLAVLPVSSRAQDVAARAAATQEDVLVTLKKLASQPAPAGLNGPELSGWAAQTQWMESAYAKVLTAREHGSGMATGRSAATAVATAGDVKSPRDAMTGQSNGNRSTVAPSAAPTEKRQHGVNPRDIVMLVATLEQEGRQFNTLSNASKARHDIAMNAIRNMK